MIRLEQLETPELERLLAQLGEKLIPVATRHAVNNTAWEARKLYQAAIGDKLTLRNKWTQGSARVKPTKTLGIRRMEARVGSTQEYMRRQEEGHVEVAGGRHGVAIPTGYAAGQEGQKPRTKLPRRPNRMQNIRLLRFARLGKTPKQRLLRSVQKAILTGNRFIFADFGPGKRKGILKVLGGRKKFTRGWPKGARLRMVQDLTHRHVVIKENPLLTPAAIKAREKFPEFYRKALIFLIRKKTRAR